MTSKIVTLRVSPSEHEAWRKAASPHSFNSWARGVLNEALRGRAPVRDGRCVHGVLLASQWCARCS